jgi:hypothetical protein
MHPAAKLQFERTAREFAQWRAVPEEDRSPAPAWWWQPAFEVVTQLEEMGALLCYRLQLPVGWTYVPLPRLSEARSGSGICGLSCAGQSAPTSPQPEYAARPAGGGEPPCTTAMV